MSDSEDRELRYADMTVLELLTEMKDTSEAMVDLAYAALRFNSQNIADEVKSLEKDIDDLKYAIRYRVMLSARTRDDARQMAGILEVGAAADRISGAAADMTELLRFPSDKRQYISRILSESDEKYRMVKISDTSDMKGHTIGPDLRVEAQTACRIIAVKNRNGWTFDPEGTLKLRVGDEVFIRGSQESLDAFVNIALGRERYDFPPVQTEEQAEEAGGDGGGDEEVTEPGEMAPHESADDHQD